MNQRVLNSALCWKALTWAVVPCLLAGGTFAPAQAAHKPGQETLLRRTMEEVVTGKVLDESNVGVPGATVVLKGTTSVGTTTDADGKFTLRVPNASATLVVSSIGFQSQEIVLGGRTTVSITLKSDVKSLSEVVVVGYGQQKKTSTTAAVSTLKAQEVASKPVVNLSNSLGGRVSGITVQQGSGEPGYDGASINIRGLATTGNSAPLVVVDGIYRDFTRLDPNTIESITVLKDAAAVAPYGLAGANGVILVTTKRGKTGAPTVTYSGYVGIQNPTRVTPQVNSYQYALMRNEAAKNEGITIPYSDEALQRFQDGSDRDLYPDSRPLQEIVKPNRLVTNHNLQISGGSDNVHYYAGLGYTSQQGMWSTTRLRKYNVLAKIDAQATKTTNVALSLNGWIEDQYFPAQSAGTILQQAFRTTPVTPVYYTNGLWGQYIGQSLVGEIYHSGYQINERNTIMTNLSIDQQLPFVKGLSVKGVASYDPTTNYSRTWATPIPFYVINTTTTPYTFTQGTQGASKPTLTLSNNSNKAFTYQGFINYHNTFGDHDITALGVIESRSQKYWEIGASRKNYNVTIDELNTGSSNQDDISNSGTSSQQRQLGYVYRVGYAYKDKYLAEVAGRYDGHFAFAPGHRWGFFPSYSLGWRLSEEDFIKNSAPWIDNLKVRASYGQSGNLPYINGNLATFQYLSTYSLYGGSALFGSNPTQGINERAQANPNITWERAQKTDLGIEASIFRGVLNFEADFFYEKRKNMLVTPNVVVPAEYGIGISQVNAGEMVNRGFELSVTGNHRFSNGMRLSVNGNFTYAKNKLLQFFETSVQYNNPNRRRTGRPLNTQFGYQALGLFQQSDDTNGDGVITAADGYAISQPWGAVRPGDIKYADLSGPDGVPDGKIDAYDETVIGNPRTPQISFGLTPSLSWKGFNLDLLFQGAAQTSLYLNGPIVWPFDASASATELQYENYWRPDRTDALYPRLTGTPATNNTQTSSFWIRNASYVRLKSFELGYAVPGVFSKKIGMQALRVFVSGQNMFTWTPSMKEIIDPEIGTVSASSSSTNGATSGYSYMQQRVFSLGANITF